MPKHLLLRISQTIDSNLDPRIDCQNYPHDGFSTYKECDEDFVYKEVSKLKIIPFWATNNMEEVTKLKKDENEPHSTLATLADGTVLSNCSRPCKSTKVISFRYQ